MFSKEDVRIPAEGGIELAAWLYVPEGREIPLPAITMAHGFGGTRYHGIEPIAQAFVRAGFVVLLHDHRGFGDSGGLPRQDINPWQQIADWRRAVSWLQDRPEVDEERVGLWGTSYAGGHAIVMGATDRRLKAVVSQVPTIDGHIAGQRRVAPDTTAALEARFAADERAQLRGEPPALQQIVSEDSDMPSNYRAPDVVSFYLQPIPPGVWENQVTVRSIRLSRMYSPGDYIDRVSPTPLMLLVAEDDTVAVTDLALKAYERALQPKALRILEGGHFDPYLGGLAVSTGAAIEWFSRHL